MTVTIDATNMTLVDAADSTTGWTSSLGGLETETALSREGGTNLADQASTETYQIYHTIASTSLSAHTIFGWQKQETPTAEADATAAGYAMYLGDGTNNRSYDVGGYDNWAFFFSAWGGFRLNTAGLPTGFVQDGGGAPTTTTITRIGYGGRRPVKANGTANNWSGDVLRYVSNTSPALLIEGGTTGARGTFGEIVTEDENTNNAWGIMRELVGGSKAYECMFGLQMGSLDATAYFEDSDFQLFLNGAVAQGGSISAGSMDFDWVGFASGTNVCNISNFFVQSIGTASNWDMSDTDIDELKWENGTFTDMGDFTFQAQDATNKFVNNVVYNNCGQVIPNGMDFDNIAINGSSNADGAMLLDTTGDSDNMVGVAFTSDGTGHAIEISVAGTYDFDNFTFDGYGADGTTNAAVYISANVAVTLNIQNGGDTPTVRNSGTAPTINNAVTIRIDGIAEGTAGTLIANETAGTVTKEDVLLEGLADANGVIEDTGFNYESAFTTGLEVRVLARNQGFPTAAIADDGGTQTDETADSNSPATNDMTLTPAVPVVGDAYYFGHNEEFPQLKVWVTTAGVNQTITWEYWNGAWTALSGVSDGTSSFTATGDNIVSWTAPSDWADTTVNSQGPYKYVRARVSAIGGSPTGALGRQCQLDVTRYLPIPPSGELTRDITSAGLTATLAQAVDSISKPFG